MQTDVLLNSYVNFNHCIAVNPHQPDAVQRTLAQIELINRVLNLAHYANISFLQQRSDKL